jgi:hypothetical protein
MFYLPPSDLCTKGFPTNKLNSSCVSLVVREAINFIYDIKVYFFTGVSENTTISSMNYSKHHCNRLIICKAKVRLLTMIMWSKGSELL